MDYIYGLKSILKQNAFQFKNNKLQGSSLLDDHPKPSEKDLWNMAFRVFNVWEEQERMERAPHDREKYQLLAIAGRSPPKKIRHQQTSPRACFECGNTSLLAKNYPLPHLWQRPYPNCGQTGHWSVECLSLSCQRWSVLQVPPPQENCFALLGLTVEDWHCPRTSAPNNTINTIKDEGKTLPF